MSFAVDDAITYSKEHCLGLEKRFPNHRTTHTSYFGKKHKACACEFYYPKLHDTINYDVNYKVNLGNILII